MRIAVLFNLENGGAISGNDNGEIGYVANEWLEQSYFGKLSKDGPRTVMVPDRIHKIILPTHDTYRRKQKNDIETIELNKYVVEAPDGDYIVRCGYGPKTDYWIIQGTANKVNQST